MPVTFHEDEVAGVEVGSRREGGQMRECHVAIVKGPALTLNLGTTAGFHESGFCFRQMALVLC